MGWVLLLIILVGVSCWRAYEQHRTNKFGDVANRLGLQFQKKAAVDPDLNPHSPYGALIVPPYITLTHYNYSRYNL